MTSNKQISKLTEQSLALEKQGFDYMVLDPDVKNPVQQSTYEIKTLMRRTAQDIINIGQKLTEVKEQLGHGHFEAWLNAEFNWGQWTARKLMQVTRQFKSVNFTDLRIDPSALYLLAAPSTAEQVRQEALQRAMQGEAISHSKVKEIASQYGKLGKSPASKPSSINISANTLETDSTTVIEISEVQQPGKIIKVSANIEKPYKDHNTILVDNSSKFQFKEQEVQSLFEVGNILYITKFEKQNYQLLGEISKVVQVNSNDIEVVMKFSLQPSKNQKYASNT